MAKAAFTIEQASMLRSRYESGDTTVLLAKEFNVKDTCIANWIRKAGGIIRSNSESKRKSVFDEHFFDVIDSEFKAYWLGFFMADGYVGKYGGVWRNFWCTLAAKDGHHLENFLADIKATYAIKYFKRTNKKTGKVYDKCRICLTSIPFVNRLIENGWLDFKRDGDCRILSLVPPLFFHHFVRGFFDGDGSIGRQRRKRKKLSLSYSVTIVAPFEHENFLNQIRKRICDAIGVTDKPLKRGKSVWRCHWNGNVQIRKIGSWMYQNSSRYLQRKKDRFDSIDSIVRFDWPPDNHFSCSHTPSEIIKLDKTDQDITIDRFCKLASASQWVPPYYTNEQLLNDLRSISVYNTNLYKIEDNGKLIGFRLNTGSNSESPGKKLVLHFQPHFWNVKTTAPTIPAQWHKPSIVRRAAAALLTTGTRITLNRYFRELRYAGAGVTSHFHPNFAMAIIKNLCPQARSWFDPCMGWGGRLIASNVLGIDYEGCDPQVETYAGLNKIKNFIGSSSILHLSKAQDFVFKRQYDLGFTSPPFFNKEKYGGNEQSYYEFPQFDRWIAEFLCPLVDRMVINCASVILHVDERIANCLEKTHDVVERYPLYLQRNPGGPKTAEAIMVLKNG
jgi:hypothetical protein